MTSLLFNHDVTVCFEILNYCLAIFCVAILVFKEKWPNNAILGYCCSNNVETFPGESSAFHIPNNDSFSCSREHLDENGIHQWNATIHSERILKVVKQNSIPALWKMGYSPNDIWFQQDGATTHISVVVLKWLKKTFEDHIVSLKTLYAWPPHSQDLGPLDFYLYMGIFKV